MARLVFVFSFLIASAAAIAIAAGAADDYVRCKDAAHVTKASRSFKEARLELRAFTSAVCDTAPAVCSSAYTMLASMEEMGTALTKMEKVFRDMCQ